jgi:hypothetical protein
MTRRKRSNASALAVALVAVAAFGQNPAPRANNDLGDTDTPLVPGQQWHVHDPARPHPPVVAPGAKPGDPPSDAIVLFDCKDLSNWLPATQTMPTGVTIRPGPPGWKVENGYMEIVPGSGDLATKEKFGDVQVHAEFALPTTTTGSRVDRGNSGIFLQGRYEVQIFDEFENPIYADGQIGAIYGQWPPLANAGRGPGKWQVYDIVFEAPRMDGNKVLKPAYLTAFLNGVVIHNRLPLLGPTVYRAAAKYIAQPAEDAIVLQNHNSAVRFRNIWARRIGAYDSPEPK